MHTMNSRWYIFLKLINSIMEQRIIKFASELIPYRLFIGDEKKNNCRIRQTIIKLLKMISITYNTNYYYYLNILCGIRLLSKTETRTIRAFE